MAFYTYLLTSQRNGTLYCGHTDDLGRRVWEHKEKIRPGFTAEHDIV
jgi:putative endonuclease